MRLFLLARMCRRAGSAMEPAARCCALGGPCSVTSPGQTARLRSATLSPRCPSSLPANGRCHPVAPFPCFRCPCLLRQPCPRPLDTRFHVPPPEDQVQQPLPIHLAPRGMKHPLRAMPDPVAVEGDFRAHGSASSRVARARASASSSAIRSNIDVPPAGVRRRSSHCSSLLARVSSLHRGSPGACMACATRVTRRCSLCSPLRCRIAAHTEIPAFLRATIVQYYEYAALSPAQLLCTSRTRLP